MMAVCADPSCESTKITHASGQLGRCFHRPDLELQTGEVAFHLTGRAVFLRLRQVVDDALALEVFG
jgi:hypothetical protein